MCFNFKVEKALKSSCKSLCIYHITKTLAGAQISGRGSYINVFQMSNFPDVKTWHLTQFYGFRNFNNFLSLLGIRPTWMCAIANLIILSLRVWNLRNLDDIFIVFCLIHVNLYEWYYSRLFIYVGDVQ